MGFACLITASSSFFTPYVLCFQCKGSRAEGLVPWARDSHVIFPSAYVSLSTHFASCFISSETLPSMRLWQLANTLCLSLGPRVYS
jgi:hypothetical protein